MSGTVFKAGESVAPLEFSVNPSYPGKVILRSGSVRAFTEGGDEYVYDKGPGHILHVLRFEGLPASDFDGGYDYASRVQAEGTQSLVNWFLGVAGGLDEFTYQDAFGKERAVVFADDGLEFHLADHGLYDGVINLRERLG